MTPTLPVQKSTALRDAVLKVLHEVSFAFRHRLVSVIISVSPFFGKNKKAPSPEIFPRDRSCN